MYLILHQTIKEAICGVDLRWHPNLGRRDPRFTRCQCRHWVVNTCWRSWVWQMWKNGGYILNTQLLWRGSLVNIASNMRSTLRTTRSCSHTHYPSVIDEIRSWIKMHNVKNMRSHSHSFSPHMFAFDQHAHFMCVHLTMST